MYIPKNKIITNQYSNDSKLVYKSTGAKYIGFYHKTYNGKYFTGKTPNDKPNDELVLVEDTSTGFTSITKQSKLAYTDAPTIFDDINNPNYSEEMVINYALLKGIDLNKTTYKNLPSQFYPKPTESDYKLGTFTRYFCVKINENSYLELNKETHSNLSQQLPDWNWEPYIIFTLPWTLKGTEKEVYRANFNVVVLQEQRSKRYGLNEFLKNNYLKFWIPQ